jgi:beta-mannosidase
VRETLPAGEAGPHRPEWKAGSPRDRGAGWDFDDVRDDYLRRLFGLDPFRLRYSDPERYLELSRVVTGELMAAVFARWRAGDTCRGGLVWWWRDLVPGAGWGVIDSAGRPKAAYHYLRRAWQPLGLSLVDHGLGGLRAVVHNEGPEPVAADLVVLLVPPHSPRAVEARRALPLEPRQRREVVVEDVLGGFRDLNHAYRFGPPSYELVAARLDSPGGERLAEDYFFPGGPPAGRRPDLALRANACWVGGGVQVDVIADRSAYGVTVELPGFEPDDAYFTLVPGQSRRITLHGGGPPPVRGRVTAVNSPAASAFEVVR